MPKSFDQTEKYVGSVDGFFYQRLLKIFSTTTVLVFSSGDYYVHTE